MQCYLWHILSKMAGLNLRLILASPRLRKVNMDNYWTFITVFNCVSVFLWLVSHQTHLGCGFTSGFLFIELDELWMTATVLNKSIVDVDSIGCVFNSLTLIHWTKILFCLWVGTVPLLRHREHVRRRQPSLAEEQQTIRKLPSSLFDFTVPVDLKTSRIKHAFPCILHRHVFRSSVGAVT